MIQISMDRMQVISAPNDIWMRMAVLKTHTTTVTFHTVLDIGLIYSFCIQNTRSSLAPVEFVSGATSPTTFYLSHLRPFFGQCESIPLKILKVNPSCQIQIMICPLEELQCKCLILILSQGLGKATIRVFYYRRPPTFEFSASPRFEDADILLQQARDEIVRESEVSLM